MTNYFPYPEIDKISNEVIIRLTTNEYVAKIMKEACLRKLRQMKDTPTNVEWNDHVKQQMEIASMVEAERVFA